MNNTETGGIQRLGWRVWRLPYSNEYDQGHKLMVWNKAALVATAAAASVLVAGCSTSPSKGYGDNKTQVVVRPLPTTTQDSVSPKVDWVDLDNNSVVLRIDGFRHSVSRIDQTKRPAYRYQGAHYYQGLDHPGKRAQVQKTHRERKAYRRHNEPPVQKPRAPDNSELRRAIKEAEAESEVDRSSESDQSGSAETVSESEDEDASSASIPSGKPPVAQTDRQMANWKQWCKGEKLDVEGMQIVRSTRLPDDADFNCDENRRTVWRK